MRLAVPVQIEVLQQPPAFGLIERRDLPVRSGRREDAEIVLPVQRLFDARVAFRTLPRISQVLGDAVSASHRAARIAVRRPANQKQAIPVEQRVGRQRRVAKCVEAVQQIEDSRMQFRVGSFRGMTCVLLVSVRFAAPPRAATRAAQVVRDTPGRPDTRRRSSAIRSRTASRTASKSSRFARATASSISRLR